MSEYTTQVGMDVHARSVSCKAMRPDTGECWSRTFSGEGHEHELLEWLGKLPGPVRCAYESGCTGFWLSRFLERGGVACGVVAVSTLPRSPKNRRHKDDRRDAAVVLREMCNPASDVSYVWIPDPEVEGARDLARAADTARREVKSAKQRVGMLLVKHGFVWNERTERGNLKATWTPAWRKWALSCDLGDPMSNKALEMGVGMVERMERSAGELICQAFYIFQSCFCTPGIGRWVNERLKSFFTKDNGTPMHPDSITDWLNKFSDANDLPHIHPHAFRHTVASILISSGIDPVTTSNELGHADANTTNAIYAHQIARARAEASGVRAGVFSVLREA